jgi:acyl-coenzyme A synthetase/AMP-(fatty) acid ligase
MDAAPNLKRFDSYERACREFRWQIPERLNIATEICRRHPDAVTRIALSDVKKGGINTYTFGGLDFLSDKFAKVLSEAGVGRGDSVGILLPPSAALAVAHLGTLKIGAVVVPLSMGSDPTFLQHVLADSAVKASVIDASVHGSIDARAPGLPNLTSRFVVRDLRPSETTDKVKDFWSAVGRASSSVDAVETDSRSPAFIFYIESTAKTIGIVHSHRSILGQLAGFEMFNEVEHESGAVLWAGDDWSTTDSVLGGLYPAWWDGWSLRTSTSERDAGVRRVHVDGIYGRPETGWISGQCQRWFASPPDSFGRRVPGRSIEIIDQRGDVLGPGQPGQIAVHRSDPGLFTEYHRDAARTAESFITDWFLTGSTGYKNGDGDLFIPPSPSVVGTD